MTTSMIPKILNMDLQFLNWIWVSYPVVLYPARQEHHGMAKPSPSFAGDPALVKIGESIRRVRKELGLSQETLAHDAGVDRSYMGGVERGEHNLTVMSLLRIASALNCKASLLIDEVDAWHQFLQVASRLSAYSFCKLSPFIWRFFWDVHFELFVTAAMKRVHLLEALGGTAGMSLSFHTHAVLVGNWLTLTY
jgi:transcriptional regulator with XRE-family HTH domain